MDKPFMSMSGNVGPPCGGERRFPDQGQRHPLLHGRRHRRLASGAGAGRFLGPPGAAPSSSPRAGEHRPRRQGRTPAGQDQCRRKSAARRPYDPVDPRRFPASRPTVSRSMGSWAPCPRPSSRNSPPASPALTSAPRSNPSSTRPIPPLPPRTTGSPAYGDILGADRENLRAIAGLALRPDRQRRLHGAATLALGVPVKTS